MRIIGETETGYIVDIGRHELAHLIGLDSGTSMEAGRRLHFGAVLAIAAAWDRLQGIARAESTLAQAAKTLRAVADLVDAQAPIIVTAAKEDPA